MQSLISSRTFFLVLGAVLGCFLGYLFGARSWGPADDPETATIRAPVSKPAVARPGGASAPLQPRDQASKGDSNGGRPPASIELIPLPETALKYLTDAQAIADPEQRTAAFREVVDRLTPENSPVFLEQWMSGPFKKATDDENKLFNSRIGETYGAHVVGTRTGSSNRDLMGAYSWVRDQFLGWKRTDQEAARQWMENLTSGPFRTAMELAWDDSEREPQPER